MKTRAECLEHATMCERMAADAHRKADRMALLATAGQWRTLAEHAKQGMGDRNASQRRDGYEECRFTREPKHQARGPH